MFIRTIPVLLILSVFQAANAVVRNKLPSSALEDSVITLRGSQMHSNKNPAKIVAKTTGASDTTLTQLKSSANLIKFRLPSVSADTKVVLNISGGNVSESKPQQFVVLILDKPSSFDDSGNSNENSLPSGASSDIHASTADSADTATTVTASSQSNITTLPNLASAGSTGSTLTLKGTVSIPGTLSATASSATTATTAGTVTAASQPNITTLNGLVAAGTAGTNTTFAGPVIASQGFNGNLVGATTINGATITASSQFVGTLNGTVLGSTNGNTASRLVLRDGNGDFAAQNITANGSFIGTLNGQASTALALVASSPISTLDPDASGAVDLGANGAGLVIMKDVGGDGLATISNGRTAQRLTILFNGAVSVTDNEVQGANTIDIDETTGNSFIDDDVLELLFDGNSWYEVGRSAN